MCDHLILFLLQQMKTLGRVSGFDTDSTHIRISTLFGKPLELRLCDKAGLQFYNGVSALVCQCTNLPDILVQATYDLSSRIFTAMDSIDKGLEIILSAHEMIMAETVSRSHDLTIAFGQLVTFLAIVLAQVQQQPSCRTRACSLSVLPPQFPQVHSAIPATIITIIANTVGRLGASSKFRSLFSFPLHPRPRTNGETVLLS